MSPVAASRFSPITRAAFRTGRTSLYRARRAPGPRGRWCLQEGTGNREQGTGNREQGTGNRGQGTGDRGQGVNRSMSRIVSLLTCTTLLASVGKAADGPPVKHVVLVSVDGLAASYLDDPRAEMP